MNVKGKLEKLYNMSFEKVISEIHIKNGKPISQISKECLVSRKAITNLCKRHGLKQMSSSEAAFLKYKNGYIHHNTGKKNPKQSELMTKNNPIKNEASAIKRAISMKQALEKMALPQEKKFQEILDELKIKYEYQKPINKYNIDFFITNKNICIEIDSTKKLSLKKKESHKKRDALMLSFGFITIRIDKDLISNKKTILNILNTNNVIG